MAFLRFTQLLGLAARNFRRFRLQAVLITVASMTGTAGVIVSTGYAAGGRQKILDQFSQLGANVIVVTPQQSRAVGGRARTGSLVTTLNASDYKSVAQSVQGIAASSPTVAGVFRIRAGDLTKSTTIVGCKPDYFAIKRWSAERGDVFGERDSQREARVVLLGAMAARDLFGPSDATGVHITINRVPFTVAGVMTERGQGLDASSEDDQVYVPLDTAMHRLMNVDYFNSILFEMDGPPRMDAAAAEMERLLGERHRHGKLSEKDFLVQNRKSLIETQLSSFARLTFLVRWIAVSALAVSSLGLFAVTWIGIRNRTREIGTRRAVGADAKDILVQFLAEGIIGAWLGCASGVVVSYLALRIIDERIRQPFLFSGSATLGEVLGSLALYSTFTLVSSIRAIRIPPLLALRAD